MKYYSTKDKYISVSLPKAVLSGLAADGGLFMPEDIPRLSADFISSMSSMTFQEIAFKVATPFFKDDLPLETLRGIIDIAFDFKVPLVNLSKNISCLELFQGPTMAFKDFGSRFMAGIASLFVEGQGKKLTILVATSGDTGSAVAAGFYQVPNIDVILLYPEGKVSHLQEKQLTTMGGNITAIEVKGSFDDCQKLVKMAFVDDKLKQKLRLTSANSINIARLLPQIFYYFYGYSRLAKGNNPIVFSVPSGNFGNLTAGLMAKKMGLPVGKFIAATNANDTVPRYLASGLFAPKPSIKTLSNSMDVGNPSNFDRILDLYDYNLETILADVYAAAFSDKKTRQAISHVYYKYQYLLDPHGAVAYLGLKKYLQEENPKAQGIFLATAHPAKFAEIVEPIIMQKIKMPANLDKVLTKKKKNAVTIPNKFSSFKSLLLDL